MQHKPTKDILFNGHYYFRSIRTNWATRKPPSVTGGGAGGGGGKELNYDEVGPFFLSIASFNCFQVFAQSSPTNCTVYAGGCTSGDENALRRAFGQFGRIMEVGFWKLRPSYIFFNLRCATSKTKVTPSWDLTTRSLPAMQSWHCTSPRFCICFEAWKSPFGFSGWEPGNQVQLGERRRRSQGWFPVWWRWRRL